MTNRISRKYQYSRKKNGSKRRSRWNESAKYRNRTKMNNMTGGAGSWDCTCRDPTNATYEETENVKTENDNTLQQLLKLQEDFKPKNDNAAVAVTAAVAAAASSLSSPPVQLPVQQQFQLPVQPQFQLPVLPAQSYEQLQQQIDALRQDILTKQAQQFQTQEQSQQDMLRQKLQQDQLRLQQLQQQEQQLRSQLPPRNLSPAIEDDIGLHNTQVSSVVSDDSEVDGQTLPSKPMLSSLPMRLDMTRLQDLRPELFRSSQGNPPVPQGLGEPVRRVSSIRQLPPLANHPSVLNTNVDLFRTPQSTIIPRVQRNGSLNINSNDLTFDDKKIIIKKHLNLSGNPNETFIEGDEIIAINGTSLRDLPSVNLKTFKELTAGNPRDKIVFNVLNRNLTPSRRVVTIELKIPPPPTSAPPILAAAAAGTRRPDLRSDLKNKGGFDFKGGKKKTIRRKKQKKRKNTKKRKVMVGGVLPENWDQYSILQKLSHASSNWKNYDQDEKIRFINELPTDNDADFKRRLGMLRNFEEIDIGRDNTSPVLELIKSKLDKESGPGAERGRVDLPLSPRNLQRQPQPDIASVLLDSPRLSSSGLVSPLASTQRSTYVPRPYIESEFSPRTNLPPPPPSTSTSTSTSTFTESPIRAPVEEPPSMMPIGQPAPPGSIDPDVTLTPGFIPQPPRSESVPIPVSPPEEPSTHHIGLRGSPPDRPPPPRPRPLKSQLQPPELQPPKLQPPELQPPDLLSSFRPQVDPLKETTDIIDIPIEPPEQQTVKPRTVVCECVPKPKKSKQPLSSSSNLTKTQRMKNFALRLFTRNKKNEKK